MGAGTGDGGSATGGAATGGSSGMGAAGGVSMTGGSGGAGTGGSGGDGGTGGEQSGCPSPTEVAVMQGSGDSLDGRLVTTSGDSPSTDDVNLIWFYYGGYVGQRIAACMIGRTDFFHDYDVAGEEGASMQVTLHFYGIMEPKNYGAEVEREAGDEPADRNGGMPLPWAEAPAGATYQASAYSSYEIHVFDEDDQEVKQYFLNSDTQEGHYTFVIDYEKTITVVGGGRIRVRRYDRDCHQIKNCGAEAGYPCADKARIVDVSAADPQPAPGALDQPGNGYDPNHAGQWWLIDVTNVTCE